MNKRIMNIVNFVRGIDPDKRVDLCFESAKQIEINKKYGIPNTFLLQYDAMLRDDIRNLFLKERDDNMELGVWFENCKDLIEKIGLQWRGRVGWDWDWHVNSGFLMGYTLKEREMIVDEVFRYFKEIFGEYPQVAGSWIMDSYSMNYICEKYGVKAFCNCREQYGVDAYTLWGGYSSGGYYPAKKNMLCPAQTVEEQMDAPLFRMLGADPLYNYDEFKYCHYDTKGKGCAWTMEPGWPFGQSPEIMDWYFDTYYRQPCLAFSEATTGQENSFGWPVFGEGYIMQIEKLVKLQEEGVVVLEKLGDTGENFKKAYKTSPPQAQVAVDDWFGNGIKTVWYNCKNYRANLFLKDGKLFFRDLNKYDERYEERYLKEPCEAWCAVYDALPLIDGRFWSTENGEECGIFIDREVEDIHIKEENETDLRVYVKFKDGTFGSILCGENAIIFENIVAEYSIGHPTDTALKLEGNKVVAEHNNFVYDVTIVGNIQKTENGWKITPIDGVGKICF